ncbi:hypothetical protein GLE_1774 [Lysobacter enzymogenes]|uniref:Uncharacterized protein n=1 Tax=Lysobacter enzymogenes TaxID=69 RepID=A0A0S2DFK4_LYSEN|nr:hypothetical protein GLE_1774 [Lysobacter enzymogenes]
MLPLDAYLELQKFHDQLEGITDTIDPVLPNGECSIRLQSTAAMNKGPVTGAISKEILKQGVSARFLERKHFTPACRRDWSRPKIQIDDE